MSGIGKVRESNLPIDIEERIRQVQKGILESINQKDALDKEIKTKTQEAEDASLKLDAANLELKRIKEEIKNKEEDLSERIAVAERKESALDVYSKALQAKEDKVQKYLATFERMKEVTIT